MLPIVLLIILSVKNFGFKFIPNEKKLTFLHWIDRFIAVFLSTCGFVLVLAIALSFLSSTLSQGGGRLIWGSGNLLYLALLLVILFSTLSVLWLSRHYWKAFRNTLVDEDKKLFAHAFILLTANLLLRFLFMKPTTSLKTMGWGWDLGQFDFIIAAILQLSSLQVNSPLIRDTFLLILITPWIVLLLHYFYINGQEKRSAG